MTGRKNIEKIFIVFFMIILIIPLMGIFRENYNAEQIIKLENRNINTKPNINLITKKDFYIKTEKWFNDRFLGREYLTYCWSMLHYKFDVSTSKYAVIGKNQWIFNKNTLPEEMKNWNEKKEYIKKIKNYCQKNNITFLLLIPPNKEYIYPECYPNWLKSVDYKNFQDKVENSLSLEKVKYLFLTETMLDAKQFYTKEIYFKDDHHWNYYGSFEGTKKMLEMLKKEGVTSELEILKLDNTFTTAYKEASLARELKIPYAEKTEAPWNENFTNEIYEIDESTGVSIKIQGVITNDYVYSKSTKFPVIIENKNIKNNTTMLIIGDSFTGYMLPYITQTVRKVIIINNGKKIDYDNGEIILDELINKYHPDVFIYERLANQFYGNKLVNEITIK